MKPMLALAVAVFAGSGTGVLAQNYPWCANFADGAGVNCGFPSQESCMATAIGSGGSCSPNNLYKAPAAAAQVQHRPARLPTPRLSTIRHRTAIRRAHGDG